MSNMRPVPEEITVGRGDPVYMAHAYLTKVPVPGITPFINAYSQPGDVVADPFAGSGMTGVAALISGRHALLSDISILGKHIGSNYATLVDADAYRKAAKEVIDRTRTTVGDVYDVVCGACGEKGELAKTVWSIVVRCPKCANDVDFYRSLEAAEWSKAAMRCPSCDSSISSRAERVGEVPVVDYVKSRCSTTQVEQRAATHQTAVQLDGAQFPHVEITPDREMYKAQSLGKTGMTTVASFYSPRNLRVLAALREEIEREPDLAIRAKLLFAFTATLTRASKRYQWSKKRPLNAANANYYVAAVFYEWNVFELFGRKVEAAVKSDRWIRDQRGAQESTEPMPSVTYSTQSAASLNYADDSVDYVFTDPPFGSNLFYADMALFQEGWLGDFTDFEEEAVIDRSRGGMRSAARYETLLTDALSECRRIVKPGGRISMVFGNSSGKVWAVVQRAVAAAGLMIDPSAIVILNKGQRSVKGLASGFEHVATLDLVLTMTATESDTSADLHIPTRDEIQTITRSLAENEHPSPSHLYLELLRHALLEGWSVAALNLRDATAALIESGWVTDSKTGSLVRASAVRSFIEV